MKKLVIALILVGVIAIALNTIFGWQTVTYLSVYRTGNNIYLYKFNIWGYVENLKNSFGTVTYLGLDTPSRQWVNITSTIIESQFWEDLGNNMALMLDWVLFGLTIMIYPFRIGGYIILQLLAILGINTIDANMAGGLNWLVIVAQFVRDLQIPYV